MITMTRDIVRGLIDHARASAPIEACGYLAGKGDAATERLPLRNVDASAEHFALDPAEQFDAVRAIRGKGLKLLAVYHSHPATPARPSQEDIRLAFDPGMSYVIVSLAQTEPMIRSFRIRNGAVEEEPVITIEGGAS